MQLWMDIELTATHYQKKKESLQKEALKKYQKSFWRRKKQKAKKDK